MSKGIYCIRNKVTSECYVGSSVNIEARWSIHKVKLNRKCHHSQKLQAAWNRYGQHNFYFEIIERIFDSENKTLAEREQHWIDKYDSYKNGYNSTPIASRPFTLTDEERDIRSELMSYGLYEPKYAQKIRMQNPLQYDLEKQEMWELEFEKVNFQHEMRILSGWCFFIIGIITFVIAGIYLSPLFCVSLLIIIYPLIMISVIIGNSKKSEWERMKNTEPKGIAQWQQDSFVEAERDKRRRGYIPRRRWY